MDLVQKRAKIKTGFPTDGLFIIVGQPKSGKSTFAASFPDSYVLECEPGGGDRIDGRIHNINSLNEFREAVKSIVAEPSIKTIVIDTIDALSDWVQTEVAQAKGLDKITDRKPGVDGFEVWGNYRDKIESITAYLRASGKLVILVAHCKEAKADDNGNIITPMGINVPGKSGSYLAAQADIIGYAFKRQLGSGTQYVLTFQGGPLGAWGSRVEEVNDKTIMLPKNNPYSAFEGLFKIEGHKESASTGTGAGTRTVTGNGIKKERMEKTDKATIVAGVK